MFFLDGILNSFRGRLGKSFRKKLGVYNYKIGHQQYHKKPGVIKLHTKETLSKKKTYKARMRISELEKLSKFPFGKFTKHGNFIFDKNKVPFYDIPDLTDFKLQPYVSVHTPLVNKDLKEKVKRLNDYTVPENLERGSENIRKNIEEKVKSEEKLKIEENP